MAASSRAFGVRETHGILWRDENRVRVSSDACGWNPLYVSAQLETAYEASYDAVRDHLVILHLDGPVGVSRVLGASRERRLIPPGGLFVLPGGVDFGVRLEDKLESLHVYLRHDVLAEVAADLITGDPARLEIKPGLGVLDPLIERLALAVRDAAGEGEDPAAATYVDYLARMLAARLVRGHAVGASRAEPDAAIGRLSPAQLARTRDFIEAHLDQSLDLAAIAGAVGLGATHFARRFKRTTGVAPHRYLLRSRVERAKRLLADADPTIADVALACGFANQEHLTRVFGRLAGVTPAVYRRAARG